MRDHLLFVKSSQSEESWLKGGGAKLACFRQRTNTESTRAQIWSWRDFRLQTELCNNKKIVLLPVFDSNLTTAGRTLSRNSDLVYEKEPFSFN